MSTCDRCHATLSLYEYNRAGDEILCDKCAKGGTAISLEKKKDDNAFSVAGHQLFEEYASVEEFHKDERFLKEHHIDVLMQSQDSFEGALLGKKRKTKYLLFVPTEKLSEANALFRHGNQEGPTMLLRNAPTQLLIRRILFVLGVISAPLVTLSPGSYIMLLGFIFLGIALTIDLEWNVTYLCSNSKCRVPNRKNAHYCTHCGAHFETVEYRESYVEKYKKSAWK